MQLSFAIETSQPSGSTFRLAMGISVPMSLVWALISLAGLIWWTRRSILQAREERALKTTSGDSC